MSKRIFLLVLEGLGIGELPDAAAYHDKGCNALLSAERTGLLRIPNLKKIGLPYIDGVNMEEAGDAPRGAYGKVAKVSPGQDIVSSYWELAGVVTDVLLPDYPYGFPVELLDQLTARSFRKILCNRPYPSKKVLQDFGRVHIKSGSLIVYTSTDSVMNIAAHEQVIAPEQLYEICEEARQIMHGENAVGRVIARPFTGGYPNYTFTYNRRDFTLLAARMTMLENLQKRWIDVIAVGRAFDYYSGKGIAQSIKCKNNTDGMKQLIYIAQQSFSGLCMVSLPDLDILGHESSPEGYATSLSAFDSRLGELMNTIGPDDVLILTASHSCDPCGSGKHTREYAPLLLYGDKVRSGVNLGSRRSLADIAATIQEYFNLPVETSGRSFCKKVISA